MTTKTTIFLLFFCLSNLTVHAMNHHAQIAHILDNLDPVSMNHIENNLHGNKKKRSTNHSTHYNYKTDRSKEQKRKNSHR